MSESNTPTESGIAARTRRARTEQMDVWLQRAGGVYGVHSESGKTYEVDVTNGSCTCPDAQEREPPNGCKHLQRVELEIDAGSVPRPDGRLPSALRCDGGWSTSSSSTDSEHHEISGPYIEYNRDGEPTGETFYRCSCGREALRVRDLHVDGCLEGTNE